MDHLQCSAWGDMPRDVGCIALRNWVICLHTENELVTYISVLPSSPFRMSNCMLCRNGKTEPRVVN